MNVSELSELSSDDKSEDERNIMGTIQKQDKLEFSDNSDDKDDVPLAQLAANQIPNNDATPLQQPSN